ncbi:FprA family A-type flavoprotein [Olsenella sp. YH-ols2217]|uniref:FprA family A-type flavoprotein n=1 Tax=Kribbibacterium absianum TaxID=3044210 RepID=A0ABT6ZJR5_9ACTN|nr:MULTISPECIES: FprA family A-type flavoprotein [unclassified Olsenella]MDJ1122447.1 FprA family A-type flavoprotein [Olsenella sp. YH-ols2216]MDJ1129299.1 FprA family A-type flavoprotein [Olsenella sp. YH-ols2217]
MQVAQQIKPDIYWVGTLDWNERHFHGYVTERGLTYNAYLILDEKVTLIDTVKNKFHDVLMQRISSVIDPAKIDVVISNHVEMDHSGSLPEIKKACPNAEFYCSEKAVAEFAKHYQEAGIEFHALKTGDTLNIGKRTLTFVETPMVHWPDNMVTYDEYDKVLFSNDAFGQHIACTERFDVNADFCEVMKQARKYYANIVQPYGMQAKKALDVVKTLDLEMIAPAHGVIWTEHIPEILEQYTLWTNNDRVDKCAIVYDSMWDSTAYMARAICEGFVEAGVDCRYFDVKDTHESDILAYIMDCKYVAVGSPTLNMKMMPNVAKFLTYFLGLSPRNQTRVGLAFGSYGWAPVGPKSVYDELKKSGFQLPMDAECLNWRPTQEYLDDLQARVKAMVLATE